MARAVAADRLDAAPCYKQLYDCVVTIPADEPWRLVETVASSLCQTLSAQFPHMTIEGHRPQAEVPIAGPSDAGIVMTRHRAGVIPANEVRACLPIHPAISPATWRLQNPPSLPATGTFEADVRRRGNAGP
jgi:hypothetical protein